MRKLNSLQIFKELKKDLYSKQIFKNVVPRNRLPKYIKYPSAYVINTHNHNQPGEHWLAVYFDNKRNCEFFDSYGLSPNFYNFEKSLKKLSKNIKFNSIQLQADNSFYCGYYCVYFILLKSRNFSLKEIQQLFSDKDFRFNDDLIKNII